MIRGWREGYAWLAGGTWLFSEPQLAVDTLRGPNWRSLEASSAGLDIAATCRIAELAAPLLRECCHALLNALLFCRDRISCWRSARNLVVDLPLKNDRLLERSALVRDMLRHGVVAT